MTTPYDPDITAEFWGPDSPRRPRRVGARLSPLALRLAIVVSVGVLMVPVAVAMRASEPVGPVVYADSGSDDDSGVDSQVVIITSTSIPEFAVDPESASGGSSAPDSVRIVSLPILNPPERLVASSASGACQRTYRVHAGDSWIRIAASGKMKVEALLLANGSRMDTVIHPGKELCIPAGAQMPTPPPTPTTTVRPPTTTRVVRSTSPSAPAPAPSPARAPVTAEQVVAMIREIWPAELAERAIAIAHRESRHRADAYNGRCCYGVFQIYWNVHRSWMAAHGVTSVNQLYDARTNIQMAYQIYQRAGGWGPWT
jgi:LysM repeat protein